MKAIHILVAAVFALSSCSKSIDAVTDKLPSNHVGQFVKYTIQKGSHYCNGNVFKSVELSEMKFSVRFDSSAIYRTLAPENQYDINKLYGFSDNNWNHHQYSARFGWRWSANALRLFAYVYNNAVVTSKELTSIPIGAEINCAIRVTSTNYIFSVNDVIYQFPRTAGTQKAKGYQLYPYFGGDEVAPHDISIWVKDLE